jgi:hypothetical protein
VKAAALAAALLVLGTTTLGVARPAESQPLPADPATPTQTEAEQRAEAQAAVTQAAAQTTATQAAEAQTEKLVEPSWTIPVLHGTGLFVTLRLTEAYLYPNPFAETRLSVIGEHYKQAFTRPPKFDASQPAFEWDGDPWYINALGHAAMGSELYLRARTCGLNVLQSLLFTAGGAAVWDYAFEGSGVRPSAFDLVYTPAAGLALGELRYLAWRGAAGVSHPLTRGVLRGLFDPLGEFERWAGAAC